ncbi:MAG: riboflavin synthase [Candidatus Krumholzibacteriia bacterium]
MFTGIVQEIGVVANRQDVAAGVAFVIAAPSVSGRLGVGDSVAVNGVCQTVETVDGEGFGFTAVGETLRRTTLDSLEGTARVNLEAAATPLTALGGHLVQGHVDGVGEVESFATEGKDKLLTVRLPERVWELAVDKGSIAIDGVSLTVVVPKADNLITVTIVPFTLENTIIGDYGSGTRVNVEADIIGKYVMEYLRRIDPENRKPYQEEM